MRDTGPPGEGPRVLLTYTRSCGRRFRQTYGASSPRSTAWSCSAPCRATPSIRLGRRRLLRCARRRLRHS
eukprot:13807971-Heterocapsa_arctica.AAC.1